MRCLKCGWIVDNKRCPCGAAHLVPQKVPVGTRVAFRYGRGPSMPFWSTGEIVGHQGKLHQVSTRGGNCWVEIDDLLPDSPERDNALTEGTRVWALWVDGRWFPGTIDGEEGRIRHVTWDDGDAMWLEPDQMVVMISQSAVPQEGSIVLAKHWNGETQPARVEQREGMRFRVIFRDGEESWLPADDLTTFPPNPFDNG